MTTSSINSSQINVLYPVAGQDNDTQGFRDNFNIIQQNFNTAAAEITNLFGNVATKPTLVSAPLTLSSLGVPGYIAYDNDYMYFCVASNKWLQLTPKAALFGNTNVASYLSSNITFASTGVINVGNLTVANLTVTNLSTVNKEVVTTTEIIQGNIVANATTPTTSISTGALISKGGLGVAGNLYVGGFTSFIGNVAHDAGTMTIYDSIIDLHTYGNLATWATDDGKDIGLRMHYYNGADQLAFLGLENSSKTLQFLINATEVSGNVTGTFGNAQLGSMLLSNTTTSTSTTTGALQVAGGAGVAGNLTVGGNVTYQTGVIDSAFFVANVVANQNLFANVMYHKFVANANPNGTIANLWITLPASAENGREIKISSLTPITSCFVNQAGAPVLWVANNWSTGGNVSVTLTYNASNSKWMQF